VLGEQFTMGQLPKAIISAEPSQVKQAILGEVIEERAKTEDRTEPDWSNTLEMPMRKSVRGYRSNHKAGLQL